MNLLFLFMMSIIGFGGVFVAYKLFKEDGLYVFAIGSVVSANIFDINTYGLSVGNLTFGIDSIIYTLFIFCIVLDLTLFGKKKALTMTLSSLAAILYSGIIQFVVFWANYGIGSGIIWGLASFFISALATFVAVFISIYVYEKLFNRANIYINALIFLIISSIVNSLLYFGIMAIISGGLGNEFLNILIGSYIGKAYACLCSITLLWLIVKILKPAFAMQQNKKIQ